MKGVEVRPGSVRAARAEAGLSLAAVADGQLTRAAIHLIETGRSRPSMPTLELIARQTRKPISFFLAETGPGTGLTLRLDGVQDLIERNRHEDAIVLAVELLGKTSDRWAVARLHHWIGLAETRCLRTASALEHLRLARGMAEDLRDEWLAVECLDWEVAALTVEQDPAAFALAHEALQRCRELDPRPASIEARLLGRIGTIHLLNHEWERSIKAYEQALQAAGSLQDIGRRARIHQGLAMAYGNLGDVAREVSYATKALALHEMLHDEASLAATHNNLAIARMKQGDLAGAERHLDDAMARVDGIGLEQMKSHLVLTQAELGILRGSLAGAQVLVEEARRLAARMGENLNLGVADVLDGRIAARRGDHATADRHFAAAIATFTEADARERLVECHSAYADVLEARGDTSQALEHARLALTASRPKLATDQTEARQTDRAG